MELSVRAMAEADLRAVERLYRALVGAARRRREPIDRAWLGRAVALVGVDGAGRVRGYLVGDVRSWEFGSAPAGWIFALGVDPRVARHGLGRRLLDEAVEGFARLGIQTVRTMVRRDDVPVLRFFRGGHFTAGPYVELELDLRAAARTEA